MPVVALQGAKGGVGTSLIATNLGCALARQEPTLLLDVHGASGGDDLLLNLKPERSWADLLSVAGELQKEHIQRAVATHTTGLHLLASPPRIVGQDWVAFQKLVRQLNRFFRWILLDLPSDGLLAPPLDAFQVEVSFLVASPDPVALRAAKRWRERTAAPPANRMGLVLNQYSNRHPAGAEELAVSIDLPLVATLPVDLRAVGYQVNFGRVCIEDSRSSFGSSIARLMDRLVEGQA
jgi:pilus assembly protein CpaE